VQLTAIKNLVLAADWVY